MFRSLSRSWEFSKMSYRLIGQNKQLLVFPIISTLAALLVSASFLLPLWHSGQLSEWLTFMDEESAAVGDPMMYITAFLFYFCDYFVIVFFNAALLACVMRIMNGEEAPISYGVGMAMKRLPQITGWALLSAVVGVVLKAIEKSNDKVGRIVSALFGSAWTAVTYFVVPVVVVEGAGPVAAFKRSLNTLKTTWGTALVGNFSLGFLAFLVMLPVLLIVFALGWMALSAGSIVGLIAVGSLAVLLIVVATAFTGAADMVFKGLLYTYATGKSLPENIDMDGFDDAFRSR